MNQLAAFVAVAEAGTISGAAEKLHVSPSALSAAVTELEHSLQTQLLHRRKAKGVSLTPAGELVLPRARYVLFQAAELEADARGDERGVTGLVRLGCYPSLAPTVLPVLLSEFIKVHPEARLEVQENTQDQLTHGLESGALDLAIMYDLDLEPVWKSATLATLEPRVVLPADHRLATTPARWTLATCATIRWCCLTLHPAPATHTPAVRWRGSFHVWPTAQGPMRPHVPSSAGVWGGRCCCSDPVPM